MSKKGFSYWSAKALLVIASVISFCLAANALWLDRPSTAAVAGALCLALIVFQQLPVVESLEIFTLKAKFTNRIDQFDKLLSHVRTSAQVSSSLLYVQLAFMNRMGSIPWARKRALLADVDTLLASLSVPEQQIADTKRPFLNIVSMDLLRIFEHVVIARERDLAKDIDVEIAALNKGGPAGIEGENRKSVLQARKPPQRRVLV